MNRRLHTPIFACSAAAATLVVGLLLAWPAASAEDGGLGAQTAATRSDTAARPTSGAGASTQDAAAPAPARSRSKRARSTIAMPYFSFARGTGGRS